MNLILQAIKSLFRKLENSISANVVALSKKIITAQSTANTAITSASKANANALTAQEAAQNAQTTADAAKADAKTAQTTADKAKTTADTAQTAANKAVIYTATQSLSKTQKTTARTNIGAGEPQVNSDWAENDETVLSHVKNRTHYTYTDVHTEPTSTSQGGTYTIDTEKFQKVSTKVIESSALIGHSIKYNLRLNATAYIERSITVSESMITDCGTHYFVHFTRIVDNSGIYYALLFVLEDVTISDVLISAGIYQAFANYGNTAKKILSVDYGVEAVVPLDDKYIPSTVVKNGDAKIILASSTADSTKSFKITIDDSGTITAVEVT